jgi:hypothetical protein
LAITVNRVSYSSSAKSLSKLAAGATAVSSASVNNMLSMDPMTFNTAAQAWFPDHYFTIDTGAPSGFSNMDVVMTYAEGANPNGAGHGLGWKTTATFVKVVGTTETALSMHGPKKMLKDLNGEHILSAETAGAYLRMYVGVVTKDATAAYPDPAQSELFTNADAAGTYSGTLTITATGV